MRHPNIIKLYEVYNEGDFMYCVQEYCEEGDLAHHIKRQSKKGEFFSQ
jgi:serine/threonine protein kinase